MIERYKRWKAEGNRSGSESEESDLDQSPDDDPESVDWEPNVPNDNAFDSSERPRIQNGEDSPLSTSPTSREDLSNSPEKNAVPRPNLVSIPSYEYDSQVEIDTKYHGDGYDRDNHQELERESSIRTLKPTSTIKERTFVSSVITPIISDVQRKHKNNARSSDSVYNSDAVEEFRNAFDLVEKSCPGFSEAFTKEIFSKLHPSMGTSRLQETIDKLTSDLS